MSMPAEYYSVRDADGAANPSPVYSVGYPHTEQGRREAVEKALERSRTGGPQVLTEPVNGRDTVIRKFDNGKEVPT
jgi:hypothetical protein